MNYPYRLPWLGLSLRFSAGLLFTAGLPLASQAQSKDPSASASALAKYDLNKNGRLDPSEQAALQADEARGAATPVQTSAGTDPAKDDSVRLSAFEIKEANNGYYASNTMSGTRLSTKLEDLGSSISVVTKQQMSDFAMLDINDVFAYETGTEGTGNYTAFEVDRNGMVTDQVQSNPQGSNRIRGVGAANISLDGFATSGRVPLDPINIDAVEISRGPNSNIFGLGEGSGTVNMIGSTANFTKSSAATELRIDDVGGWRTSLDLNRPLIKDKLAARVSAVYQHDAFRQKPSGYETRRFNAMLRAQPFKSTTIRASYQSYHADGTRANAITPRDAVTDWKRNGSPTWDPTTSTVTVNGVSTFLGTTNPTGLAGQNFTDPVLFVDGGIKLWEIGRAPIATATNGPNNVAGDNRLLETVAEPVRTGRPLFSTLAGVSSKSIYDYSDINLAAPNYIKDQVQISTIQFEQYLLDTEKHKLAFQFAWQREDADRLNRNVIGSAGAGGNAYYLYVDPNSKLLDGRANPYYLRPYIGVGEPINSENPYVRDAYRSQLAYIVDFTKNEKWTKWLGRHQFLGYYEERKTKTYSYRFRDVMISDNPIYAPAGQPKGNQSISGVAPAPVYPVSPLATRGYYHFYVGDNQGYNVDNAPSPTTLGNYTFNWFNPQTNAWVADPATLGRSGITEGTAGNFGVLNLIKTKGAMMQNYFLDDRIVTTFGKRRDENRNKSQRPSALKANGYDFDFQQMDGWVGDWALREGPTTTSGAVVKPFRGWDFIERGRVNSSWGKAFGSELLSGLSFFYNKSDSFKPEVPAISVRLQELPNPTSKGKDYGVMLNLGNKFVLRVNKYETKQINSRAGQSAVFGQRVLRVDIENFAGNNDAISLQRQARLWVTQFNPTFSAQQVQDEVLKIMQLSPTQVAAYNSRSIAETSDVIAKGEEYEISYNPNSYWTLRANASRSEAIDANLSPNIPAWIAERLPIWEKIIDPRVGTPWLDTGYTGDVPTAGAGTPRTFLTNNVTTPLSIAQATEGKARPETREWRFNLSTSYRLAGITEHRILKHVGIGGAVRWESTGAIGYYGIPVNGSYEAATKLDINKPIYDEAHAYFDGFLTYNTRLFGDKVRARFQLNVRNIQESRAHLQPIGAYPNGVAHTFRIIDPRTFILTAGFDL